MPRGGTIVNVLVAIAAIIVAFWVISLVFKIFAGILAILFHWGLPIAIVILVIAMLRKRSSV